MQFTILPKLIAHLLPSLYSEYCDLSLKLQKLSELINAYGGILPSVNKSQDDHTIKAKEDIPEFVPVMKPEAVHHFEHRHLNLTPVATIYPKDGSWRAKMLYCLRHFSKPVTAVEVANYILTLEESHSEKTIYERTTDYLCKLDKERRVVSDRSDRPFKYSLPAS
ncbi:hypothetical protein [Taibaiella koreensis]|uniref:hypothetical protein n=1 Tax=Taibaiella koreensis TaxID=1268548 RepID=UPI0013C35EF2|nr:hypothetical protein [Taibaiella koreensis]